MAPLNVTSINTKERIVLETVVGRSYNVLENPYVTPEKVNTKYPILMMNKIKTAITTPRKQDTEYISGNSLREIAEAFSVSVSASSEAMMFSASVSTDFAKETKSSSEMAYCKVLYLSIKRKESFAEVDEYKKHLDPRFVRDLNSLAPELFFKNYGTHLITDAWFGGRLEFNFSKEKKKNETKESVKTSVEAGFKKIFSTKVSTEFNKEVKEVFENSSIVARAVGGSGIAISDLESFGKEYGNWIKSLDKGDENWSFCGLPDENSLVPLWELTNNPSRRKELKDYYFKKASLTRNGLEKTELFVKDITFVNHSNRNQAIHSRPAGYILVDKDLNAGAKGDYIYLCYKLGEGKSDAITNCLMEETKNSKNAAANINQTSNRISSKYYRHGMDLNKGAGGNYIYLYYTKDTRFTPIKRMEVVFGDEEIAKEDWEVVFWAGSNQAGDCNKSVGGKYIYIYMKRS